MKNVEECMIENYQAKQKDVKYKSFNDEPLERIIERLLFWNFKNFKEF